MMTQDRGAERIATILYFQIFCFLMTSWEYALISRNKIIQPLYNLLDTLCIKMINLYMYCDSEKVF